MNDQELISELCQYYKLKEKDGKSLCKIKGRILRDCVRDEKRPFIRHIDSDDLNDAAILGIVEGINTYDAEKGTKLTTWCRYKIMEQVRKVIRQELKFIKGKEQENLGEEPVSLMNQVNIQVLINALEQIPSRQSVVIKKYIGLNDIRGEKRQTFSHIGKDMGVSKQRVQQIYQQGLKNLRKEFLRIYPELFRN